MLKKGERVLLSLLSSELQKLLTTMEQALSPKGLPGEGEANSTTTAAAPGIKIGNLHSSMPKVQHPTEESLANADGGVAQSDAETGSEPTLPSPNNASVDSSLPSNSGGSEPAAKRALSSEEQAAAANASVRGQDMLPEEAEALLKEMDRLLDDQKSGSTANAVTTASSNEAGTADTTCNELESADTTGNMSSTGLSGLDKGLASAATVSETSSRSSQAQESGRGDLIGGLPDGDPPPSEAWKWQPVSIQNDSGVLQISGMNSTDGWEDNDDSPPGDSQVRWAPAVELCSSCITNFGIYMQATLLQVRGT